MALQLGGNLVACLLAASPFFLLRVYAAAWSPGSPISCTLKPGAVLTWGNIEVPPVVEEALAEGVEQVCV